MLAAMKQDRSEHFNRVPKVTVDFWLVKLMAVTMGETAADYLAVNLGLGLGAPIPFNVCNIVRSGVAPLPSTAEQPTFWDMPCVRPCFKPPGTTNCEIQRDQTQWVVTIAPRLLRLAVSAESLLGQRICLFPQKSFPVPAFQVP